MKNTIKKYQKHLAFYTLAAFSVSALPYYAFAQDDIDAGRTVQEMKKAPEFRPSEGAIDIKTIETKKTKSGGAEVTLKEISFEGNTVFSADELKEVLASSISESYDFAGLQELTAKVTKFYQDNNYPFARAYLSPQKMKDGKLKISIVEGVYGEVNAINDDADMVHNTHRYLRDLKTGEVIKGEDLERVTLILNDLPGLKTTPLIRPGKEKGQGDLLVRVKQEKRFGGSIGVNNYGNRYTGRRRANLSLYGNSQLLFGDQISFSGMYTSGDMYLGSASYAAPVGTSGLRGNISYSKTSYEVGKEYESLDSKGEARVFKLGASYPMLRSQEANINLAGSFIRKRLRDITGSTDTINKKRSNSFPVSVDFDFRDSIGKGAVTYGSVGVTYGRLKLDDELRVAGETTAKTEGEYEKLTLDVARIQVLPKGFQLYAHGAAQIAYQNLDSSEGFGLGGKHGVRAYPSGEGYGDEGWLYNLEMRYPVKDFTPYAFYDAGRIRINADPWDNSNNHRSISGAGAGLRYSYKDFSADVAAAWRIGGGDATSDSKDDVPMVWVGLSYNF